MWDRAKQLLGNNKVLFVILCIATLARIPSLLEPYWYGDEAIYLTIGQAMRAGIQLYSGIHDNKPPLLYVAAAIAGGNQFWFKLITLGWSTLTIVVFYKLAESVFKKQKWVILATGVFAFLTSWPKLEGNIANAELFFLLPTLGAALLLWKKPTNKTILYAGILLGLGAMFKMPAVLEAGVWPIIWMFEKDKRWWKKTMILALGIIVPIGVSVGYFGLMGSWKEYLTAAWAQNIPYLSSWKAVSDGKGIYTLTGRMVFAGIWIFGVLLLSNPEERRIRILGIWIMIGLFAALLSGRPYPHYLIQIAGALAVWVVMLGAGNKKEKLIGILVLATITTTGYLFKFYNYQVIGYYKNFGDWFTGRKSKDQYFYWFNTQVNNNYRVAGLIVSGTNPKDKIFVWGDEPVIYALSKRLPVGKYTVKYHIKDLKAERETIQKLNLDRPKYIVSYGKEEELPGLEQLMSEKYIRQEKIGEAVVYKRYN